MKQRQNRCTWTGRLVLASLLAGLTACGAVEEGTQDVRIGVAPLSKVAVYNGTGEMRNARMNWPDGFVQVSRVDPGATQWLSGAIGTSGFPRTIDILAGNCEVLGTLDGLPHGTAGLITLDQDGAQLRQIVQGDAGWTIADSVWTCGATDG